MAVYNVTNPDSALASVEFTPVSDGNFSFFSIRNPMQTMAVKQWLTSREINQEIISETLHEGRVMIVTHGDLTKDDLILKLHQRGDTLAVSEPKKATDPWKQVAMLAVPGQFLQLASSLMRKDGRTDWGLFVFAASNLLGHAITWTYGAQQSDDRNRLDALKQQINTDLSGFVQKGETLPDTHDKRMRLREEDDLPKTLREKTNGFLTRNSVYVGELMCRYLGAFSLAFPVNQWGKAMQTGSLSGAYNAGRNPATLTHYAGLASLTGKSISFMAKTEDPYDPKPKSWLDNMREKVAFRAGGWIEAGAFGTMTYDALTNPNRRIVFRGKEYRDYVGALGASLFTVRYIMRHWAKFGEKHIDMKEAFAHAADALAKVPTEALPRATAKAASDLSLQLKDEQLNYGDVYSRLMNELYASHHISLTNLGTEPEERKAKFAAQHKPQNGSQTLAESLARRQNGTPQNGNLASPSGNYAESVRQLFPMSPLGLGV